MLFGFPQGSHFRFGQFIEVVSIRDPRAALRFEFTAGVAGNFAASARGLFVFREALCVLFLGYFGRGSFAQHGEDEFQVRHVVAEVVLGIGEGFEVFIFRGRHAKRGLADFGGEDGKVALLLNAALFPFVREFIADRDASHPLLDPSFGVAFLLVDGPHPFGGEFGIFDFLHTLKAHPREPEFEGFGFGRRDGLDEPKQLLGIRDIGEALLPVGRGHFQSVTICNGLAATLLVVVDDGLGLFGFCLILPSQVNPRLVYDNLFNL